MEIRDVQGIDAGPLADLYNHYILNTVVTFEETAIGGEDMGQRLLAVERERLPWLVLVEGGELMGYAFAVRWKQRAAYRNSCESTIYLRDGALGGGRGMRLYTALLERLQEQGVHAVMGGIALPNAASIALHEKLGFGKVAHFAEVGRKFDRWIDVGYWQRLL